MSYTKTFTNIKEFNNATINFEFFSSANEVVEVNHTRTITDRHFDDMRRPGRVNKGWHGVDSFEEAEELLSGGYQPSVEALKKVEKCNLQGISKRISMVNSIEGFQPIVPLAIMGVPNSMVNVHMKPIKAKVIDVYYSMTANCGVSSESIIEAGVKLLSAILKLEAEGYKFNIYAIQEYYSDRSADALCIKVKDSNQPLDLKRLSYPLTHTSFFRVIGFDWYSRYPKGKYRSGYGHSLGYDFSEESLNKAFKSMFGDNAIMFSCTNIINSSEEHLKKVLCNSNNKGGDK